MRAQLAELPPWFLEGALRRPLASWVTSLVVVLAQDGIGAPGSTQAAIPRCIYSAAPDTTGWQMKAASVAPARFRAPTPFREVNLPHAITLGQANPRGAAPRLDVEKWRAPVLGMELVLTRWRSKAGSSPGQVARSQLDRDVTICSDTIGGVPVVVTSKRMGNPRDTGSSEYNVYAMFALAPGDFLIAGSTTGDQASQQMAITIIRSIRFQERSNH